MLLLCQKVETLTCFLSLHFIFQVVLLFTLLTVPHDAGVGVSIVIRRDSTSVCAWHCACEHEASVHAPVEDAGVLVVCHEGADGVFRTLLCG